jgi:hypothetical protein
LVFDKNAIFCRKWAKIAENFDINIHHWAALKQQKLLLLMGIRWAQ